MIIGQIVEIPVKNNLCEYRLITKYDKYYLFERIKDGEVLYRECFNKYLFQE